MARAVADESCEMGSDVRTILKLEVPLIVVLGERTMRAKEVVNLVPGAIVELPKKAEDELELLVNNRAVGAGYAVKVGENFGIRITYVGDIKQRIVALGDETAEGAAEADALMAAGVAAESLAR